MTLLHVLLLLTAAFARFSFASEPVKLGSEAEPPARTIPIKMSSNETQGGGRVHIEVSTSKLELNTAELEALLRKFDNPVPANQKAQLVVIADSLSSTWLFAKSFQERAIQTLSRGYLNVQSYSIDVNQPSLEDGLLQAGLAFHTRSAYQVPSYRRALSLARNATYLDDGATDYYFIFVGTGFGPTDPSTLRVFDQIDEKAKAIMVFGSSSEPDLFSTLNVFAGTFHHLEIFDYVGLGCEALLEKSEYRHLSLGKDNPRTIELR